MISEETDAEQVMLESCDDDEEEWRQVFSRLHSLHEESNNLIDIDKLVSSVMDLNQSTLSYWWRGGITVTRFRECNNQLFL